MFVLIYVNMVTMNCLKILDIQAANAVADEETKPWSSKKKLTKKHRLK